MIPRRRKLEANAFLAALAAGDTLLVLPPLIVPSLVLVPAMVALSATDACPMVFSSYDLYSSFSHENNTLKTCHSCSILTFPSTGMSPFIPPSLKGNVNDIFVILEN